MALETFRFLYDYTSFAPALGNVGFGRWPLIYPNGAVDIRIIPAAQTSPPIKKPSCHAKAERPLTFPETSHRKASREVSASA